MRNFIIGVIVGAVFSTMVVQAKDSFGRSEQQAKYDYYRQRQQQQDIELMNNAQKAEALRHYGKKNPC